VVEAASQQAVKKQSKRIVSIEWMRGLVMILMVLDHVSMAYDVEHFSADSAALFLPGTHVPLLVFMTRWVTHICAPTFVFLAGTALAISVERRVARGQPAWEIDSGILKRGAFIALLDPTVISLFSGKLIFQVLYAIGVSMMCMTALRRLPTWLLLTLVFGWWFGGEYITGMFWNPFVEEHSAGAILAALTVALYKAPGISINYPFIPWLSMMALGWVFGRYLVDFMGGKKVVMSPRQLVFTGGMVLLAVFVIFRYFNDYGNMWLYREGNSLGQWLHVSKYPPSLTYMSLEIGLMCICLSFLMIVEEHVTPNPNGVLLVFGQTAMFFYLVHRIVLEGSATWLGLRGCLTIREVYIITVVLLVALYFLCRWYRQFQRMHPGSWTRYL